MGQHTEDGAAAMEKGSYWRVVEDNWEEGGSQEARRLRTSFLH